MAKLVKTLTALLLLAAVSVPASPAPEKPEMTPSKIVFSRPVHIG